MFNLTAKLQLVDDFSKNMNKVQKSVQKVDKASKKADKGFLKLGKTMDKVAVGVAGTAVAGFGAFGAAALAAGDSAQRAQKTIIAGTGAQGEALDDLMKSYREVGSNVPQDLGQVAQAVADMNTLTGQTGPGLESTTKAVLDASRLMGEDGVENVNAFGKALNQWQVPAAKSEETAAKLYSIAQDTGIGFGELAGQLTEYGSVLNNAGFSMDEVATLFGKLSKEGLSVSRIMPGMNAAFRNWAKEGKNVQDELAGVIAKIEGAANGTEAMNIAADVFGAEGAQRLSTAIRNGTLDLEDLGGGLENAMDKLNEASEESKTFGDLWKETMNTATTNLEPLGLALLDIAKEYMPELKSSAKTMGDYLKENMPQIKESVVDFAEDARDKIDEVIDKATEIYETVRDNWPEIRSTALSLGAAFITLRGTMLALSVIQTVTTLFHALKTAMIAARNAQLLLNAAMIANPIGAVIAAISALVLAGIYLYRNFDTVKDMMDKIWHQIKSAAVGTINSMIGDINDLIRTINKIPGVNAPLVPKIAAPQIPDSMAQDAGMSPMAARGPANSHFHGLERVPYDGYAARLHKGEAVLPREEAQQYREGKGGGNTFNFTINHNGSVRDDSDIDAIADKLADKIDEASSRGATAWG